MGDDRLVVATEGNQHAMGQMQAAVHRDIRLDVTTIELRTLAAADFDALRRLVEDCMAECPCVVLVDLSNVDDAQSAATAVATAATSTRAGRPTVDVLACGLPTSFTTVPGLPVHATRADAHVAARACRERHPATRLAFDRSAGAPANVRRAVQDACAQWAVDHVATDAALIMSELVTNTIRHTAGAGTATISLREPFLHLAVEDEDPRLPTRTADLFPPVDVDHGRGMGLVELLGSSWGHRVDHRGAAKVVWAVVPTSIT